MRFIDKKENGGLHNYLIIGNRKFYHMMTYPKLPFENPSERLYRGFEKNKKDNRVIDFYFSTKYENYSLIIKKFREEGFKVNIIDHSVDYLDNLIDPLDKENYKLTLIKSIYKHRFSVTYNSLGVEKLLNIINDLSPMFKLSYIAQNLDRIIK